MKRTGRGLARWIGAAGALWLCAGCAAPSLGEGDEMLVRGILLPSSATCEATAAFSSTFLAGGTLDLKYADRYDAPALVSSRGFTPVEVASSHVRVEDM